MGKIVFEQPDIDLIEKLSAELLVANRRLEEQSERLRRSERERSEILANISHDLRAPATALRCAIDSMREYADMPPEEIGMLMGVMDRRMAVIEHLMNDLQFLVSMDLPEFTIHLEDIDIVSFLKDYFAAQQADKKYDLRRLEFDTDARLDARISADPGYLIRVLDNLFSNALRYSEDGDEIVLGCRTAQESTEVEVYVRDTGIGISSEHLEAIFERSRTISQARTPGGSTGSGLGLSIVRSIVDKHGGRVWCESDYGKGSVFRMRFPKVSLKAGSC